MMRYLDKVGARIPKINPDCDPAVYIEKKEFEERSNWGPFEGRRTLDADEI